MKNLYLLLTLLMITGCNEVQMAENLKRPIILVAKAKYNHGWAAVIVRGADGQTVTAGADYYYSKAIGESYKVGDTLK